MCTAAYQHKRVSLFVFAALEKQFLAARGSSRNITAVVVYANKSFIFMQIGLRAACCKNEREFANTQHSLTSHTALRGRRLAACSSFSHLALSIFIIAALILCVPSSPPGALSLILITTPPPHAVDPAFYSIYAY
jgi:hypothetical protein